MGGERFKEWQNNLVAQLDSVGGVAHDTKERQVAMQNDMSAGFRSIMALLQGGTQPLTQPANLTGTNMGDDSVMVLQHPDPPPGGSGKI